MNRLIAHADWSASPRKRWVCVARLDHAGGAEVFPPEPVGDPGSFVQRLRGAVRLPLLLGFDFPIGVPLAYARRLGLTSFRQFLQLVGSGDYSQFFELATSAEEISLMRPFYPRRPGGTLQQHLVTGLGVNSFEDLLRLCERRTATRGRACALFWTLGGQQVGRAALAAWREVLQPALRNGEDCALWPFDGDLPQLLDQKSVVFTETYPAEACSHLGIGVPGRGWSKRKQSDRRKWAPILIEHAIRSRIQIAPELASELEDGFGSSADGEDRFDAVIGCLAMIDVAAGRRSSGVPSDAAVRSIEGWILGQAR